MRRVSWAQYTRCIKYFLRTSAETDHQFVLPYDGDADGNVICDNESE